MRALVTSRFVLLGLVVLALAALFGVARVARPAASGTGLAAGPPRAVPVMTAVRACPAPGSGRIAVFAAPGPRPSTLRGRAVLVAAPAAPPGAAAAPPAVPPPDAGPGKAPLATVTQPGQLWLSRGGLGGPARAAGTRGGRAAAVLVEAAGPMAQGLDAEQTSYPLNGSAGSVTGVQCAEPGTDFWFLGPGPGRAASYGLYLVNPDSQPAAVDIEIFTDTGPLQGIANTSVAVPPGASVVQPVAPFLKGARVAALHVRTSVGRVGASLQAAGLWWRGTAPPASQIVIPGLPAAGRGRRLYIADPGESDAQVHVQAITSAGTYEPAGAGGIDVPSGSVIALDLPSLNGIPAALRLSSAVPVTAAVLVSGRAFTAATASIGDQGVIADNVTGPGLTASVVLSAPAGAARVHITTAGVGGFLRTSTLYSIKAGHSAEITVTVPRGARGGAHVFAIVISPVRGSGPVYAGRVLTSRAGGVQMITPVLRAPAAVQLPPVSSAPGAAIP